MLFIGPEGSKNPIIKVNRHRHGWGFDEYFLTFLLFANQETEMPQRPPSSYLTEFDLLWALDALFY